MSRLYDLFDQQGDLLLVDASEEQVFEWLESRHSGQRISWDDCWVFLPDLGQEWAYKTQACSRPQAPELGATEGQADPVVAAYYRHPRIGWRWYVLEVDQDTGEAFGLVAGFETELGYFSLDEIRRSGAEQVTGWLELPLSVVREWLERRAA